MYIGGVFHSISVTFDLLSNQFGFCFSLFQFVIVISRPEEFNVVAN